MVHFGLNVKPDSKTKQNEVEDLTELDHIDWWTKFYFSLEVIF